MKKKLIIILLLALALVGCGKKETPKVEEKKTEPVIKENDLTGKEIYIFVTSGGSSFAGSLKDLQNTYPNLNFVKGIRFKKPAEDEIKEFLAN